MESEQKQASRNKWCETFSGLYLCRKESGEKEKGFSEYFSGC